MSIKPVWVRDHIKKRKTAMGTRRNEADTPLPGGWDQLRNVTIYLGVQGLTPFSWHQYNIEEQQNETNETE